MAIVNDDRSSNHKFAWARLNSDAFFIAMLAIGSAVANLIDPTTDPNVQVLHGFVSPTFYLQAIGLLIGGSTLLYSLVFAKINVEVVGRAVILAALITETMRTGVVFGWLDNHTDINYVLVLIFIGTTIVRMTALFDKNGLVFKIPPSGDFAVNPVVEEPTDDIGADE